MLVVHMLINADDAAFEDAEIPFKRVGVNVAAQPFVLGVINRFVLLRVA